MAKSSSGKNKRQGSSRRGAKRPKNNANTSNNQEAVIVDPSVVGDGAAAMEGTAANVEVDPFKKIILDLGKRPESILQVLSYVNGEAAMSHNQKAVSYNNAHKAIVFENATSSQFSSSDGLRMTRYLLSKPWSEPLKDMVASSDKSSDLSSQMCSIVAPLVVDFCGRPRFDNIHFGWVCKHKCVSLGAIRFKRHRDIPRVTRLLNTLDTKLKVLDIDLVVGPRTAVEREVIAQRSSLIQALVPKCSTVEEFSITVSDRDIPCQLLSNMPNLLRLKLSHMDLWNPENLSSLVQHIPKLSKLERLELISMHRPFSGSQCVVIRSSSLRSLDVQEAGNVFVTCECPRLEAFCCWSKSGTLPPLSESQFDNLKGLHRDYKATGEPFVGMEVPSSCEFTVKNFSVLKTYSMYQRQLDKITAQQAAALAAEDA
ncbi:expressed unknown protein [Seminavis robusta]|uniref:Uncharacterized protein n=1 Tax=Seminavis robusta TaxID=568900 RepID=A0A9N8DJF0_9STRA|nr:expressed unknown protein [Seminavis robusta]|eukprot:Sro117_g057290.1 n/a (427) ;mRNA; f:21790-23070